MDIRIQKIAEHDLEDFCSVLQESALWLRNQGQELWTVEQLSKNKLLQEYSLDEMFAGCIEETSVATMILQEEDAVFWPTVRKNESLFLHKLSVRRQYAKSGLARHMIEWAIHEASKRGKKFLRLDCAADRPRLCLFYESLGFAKVREDIMFNRYPTAFYEIEVK